MWVNEKEKQTAKQYDVYDYLSIVDPGELVKLSQGEYCLYSHDSFKISRRDGQHLWYWYSRGIGGRTALDYLIKVKGYSFVEAVREVNRTMEGMEPSFFVEEERQKWFKLPPRSSRNDIVIGYLTARGIDWEVIDRMLRRDMIYQHEEYGSVVFIGFDDNGEPAHASYRSTGYNHAKGDYRGSDKRFAFRLENEHADTVRVFESAIDLLSYVCLCRKWGKAWCHESLISTAGITASRNGSVKLPLALEHYLEKYPDTKTILVHFDNDKAGQRCAMQIKEKLNGPYKVKLIKPKKGKDYNEYLQIENGMLEEE